MEQHENQVPSLVVELQQLKEENKLLKKKLDFYKRWASKLFNQWLEAQSGRTK